MPSNGRIIRGGLSGNIKQVGLRSIIINGQENTNKLLIKPAGQQSRLSTWPAIELKQGFCVMCEHCTKRFTFV